MTQTDHKSNGAKWFLIVGLILLALLAAAVVIYIPFFAKQPPRELAIRHVNDEIDYVGETMASWLVDENWVLKNMGGEYIEDRIHQVIKWDYSEAELIAGSRYNVETTASVKFGIDYELIGSLYIQAHLPYDVVVDEQRQTIESMTPRYSDARFTSAPELPALNPLDVLPLPGMSDAENSANSATENERNDMNNAPQHNADSLDQINEEN